MSIKTFFAKIWDVLKAEAPHAAGWEHAAATTLRVTAPLLNTLLTLAVGPAAAAKVAGIVAQVQKDMNDVAQTLSTGGSPATFGSVLGSIQSNLGTLLADADIKNETKFTEIEATVNTVIQEVEAVTASMPPAPPAPAPVTQQNADGTTHSA